MSIEHRTSSKLSSDTWQHVAVTMDSGSSTIEFYVDGKRIETTRMSESTIATNDHAIVIGKSPDARFHGAMDDVRVYNRALRSDEIAHIVRAADESALSLRYDFENCMECHGEIKFRDSGPYGYDGLCRNTGAQCDAITTDPGEFVVGSSAYRTLADEYIEIQINDESDRLQGEHLRACTFAGWIKLAVNHGAWEPVITKEGVFSFGVRDGRPSLQLGDGTILHALSEYQSMSTMPNMAHMSYLCEMGQNGFTWSFEDHLRDETNTLTLETYEATHSMYMFDDDALGNRCLELKNAWGLFVGHHTSLPSWLTQGTFSVICRFKPLETTALRLELAETKSSAYDGQLTRAAVQLWTADSNKLWGKVCGLTESPPVKVLVTNMWNELVLSQDHSKSTLIAFLNGQEIGSLSIVTFSSLKEIVLRVEHGEHDGGIVLDFVELTDMGLTTSEAASAYFVSRRTHRMYPPRGVQGKYTFDDTRQPHKDTSSAGHDASIVGAPTFDVGAIDGSAAMRFEAPLEMTVPCDTPSLSFATWVNPDSIQGMRPLTMRGDIEKGLVFGIHDGRLEFRAYNSAPPVVSTLRATHTTDTQRLRTVQVSARIYDRSATICHMMLLRDPYAQDIDAFLGSLDASVVSYGATGAVLKRQTTEGTLEGTLTHYFDGTSVPIGLDGRHRLYLVVHATDASGQSTVRTTEMRYVATSSDNEICLRDGGSYTISRRVSDDPLYTDWILVLQYRRPQGYAANASALTNRFPIYSEDGAEESEWGHTSPELFDKLVSWLGRYGVQLHVQGETDAHVRKVDFTTSWPWMVDYFRQGFQSPPIGGLSSLSTREEHTAILPDDINVYTTDKEAYAMSAAPIRSNTDHGIYLGSDGPMSWSVDGSPGDHGVSAAVWIRGRKSMQGRSLPMRISCNTPLNASLAPHCVSSCSSYALTLSNGDVVEHSAMSCDHGSHGVARLFSYDLESSCLGSDERFRVMYVFSTGVKEIVSIALYQDGGYPSGTVRVYYTNDPTLTTRSKGWTQVLRPSASAFASHMPGATLRIDFEPVVATSVMLEVEPWNANQPRFGLCEWMIYGYDIDANGLVSDVSDVNIRAQSFADPNPPRVMRATEPVRRFALSNGDRVWCTHPHTSSLFLDETLRNTNVWTITGETAFIYQFAHERAHTIHGVRILDEHGQEVQADRTYYSLEEDGDAQAGDFDLPNVRTLMVRIRTQATITIARVEIVGRPTHPNGLDARGLALTRSNDALIGSFFYSNPNRVAELYVATYTHSKTITTHQWSFVKRLPRTFGAKVSFAVLSAIDVAENNVPTSVASYFTTYARLVDPTMGIDLRLREAHLDEGVRASGRLSTMTYDPFDKALRVRFRLFSSRSDLLRATMVLLQAPVVPSRRHASTVWSETVRTQEIFVAQGKVGEVSADFTHALREYASGTSQILVEETGRYHVGVLVEDSDGRTTLLTHTISIAAQYRPIRRVLLPTQTSDRLDAFVETYHESDFVVREMIHTGGHLWLWCSSEYKDEFHKWNGDTVERSNVMSALFAREGARVSIFSAGSDYIMALLSNGLVYGFGNGSHHQFGTEEAQISDVAVEATLVSQHCRARGVSVSNLVCVGRTTVFVFSDNTVWGIGENAGDVLGLGHTRPVTTLTACVAINSKLQEGYEVDALCARTPGTLLLRLHEIGDTDLSTWWSLSADCRSLNELIQSFRGRYHLSLGGVDAVAVVDLETGSLWTQGEITNVTTSQEWIRHELEATVVHATMAPVGASFSPTLYVGAGYDTDSLRNIYEANATMRTEAPRVRVASAEWTPERGLRFRGVLCASTVSESTSYSFYATHDYTIATSAALEYIQTQGSSLQGGVLGRGERLVCDDTFVHRVFDASDTPISSLCIPCLSLFVWMISHDQTHKDLFRYDIVRGNMPGHSCGLYSSVIDAHYNKNDRTYDVRVGLYDPMHAPSECFVVAVEKRSHGNDKDVVDTIANIASDSRMASSVLHLTTSGGMGVLFSSGRLSLTRVLRALDHRVDELALAEIQRQTVTTVVSNHDVLNATATLEYANVSWLPSGSGFFLTRLANGDTAYSCAHAGQLYDNRVDVPVYYPQTSYLTETWTVQGVRHENVYRWEFYYEFATQQTVNALSLLHSAEHGAHFVYEVAVYDTMSSSFVSLTNETGGVNCFLSEDMSRCVDTDVRFDKTMVGLGRPLRVVLGRLAPFVALHELRISYVETPSVVPTYYQYLRFRVRKADGADPSAPLALGEIRIPHMVPLTVTTDSVPTGGTNAEHLIDHNDTTFYATSDTDFNVDVRYRYGLPVTFDATLVPPPAGTTVGGVAIESWTHVEVWVSTDGIEWVQCSANGDRYTVPLETTSVRDRSYEVYVVGRNTQGHTHLGRYRPSFDQRAYLVRDVRSFGYNDSGQTGVASTLAPIVPLQSAIDVASMLSEDHSLVDMYGGGHHVILKTMAHGVPRYYGVGRNESGELCASFATKGSSVPILCSSLHQVLERESSAVVTIRCGWHFTMVLLENGRMFGFGDNARGQLGTGDTVAYPDGVECVLANEYVRDHRTRVITFACTAGNTFVYFQNRKTYAIGASNEHGQLANGTTVEADPRTMTRIVSLEAHLGAVGARVDLIKGDYASIVYRVVRADGARAWFGAGRNTYHSIGYSGGETHALVECDLLNAFETNHTNYTFIHGVGEWIAVMNENDRKLYGIGGLGTNNMTMIGNANMALIRGQHDNLPLRFDTDNFRSVLYTAHGYGMMLGGVDPSASSDDIYLNTTTVSNSRILRIDEITLTNDTLVVRIVSSSMYECDTRYYVGVTTDPTSAYRFDTEARAAQRAVFLGVIPCGQQLLLSETLSNVTDANGLLVHLREAAAIRVCVFATDDTHHEIQERTFGITNSPCGTIEWIRYDAERDVVEVECSASSYNASVVQCRVALVSYDASLVYASSLPLFAPNQAQDDRFTLSCTARWNTTPIRSDPAFRLSVTATGHVRFEYTTYYPNAHLRRHVESPVSRRYWSLEAWGNDSLTFDRLELRDDNGPSNSHPLFGQNSIRTSIPNGFLGGRLIHDFDAPSTPSELLWIGVEATEVRVSFSETDDLTDPQWTPYVNVQLHDAYALERLAIHVHDETDTVDLSIESSSVVQDGDHIAIVADPRLDILTVFSRGDPLEQFTNRFVRLVARETTPVLDPTCSPYILGRTLTHAEIARLSLRTDATAHQHMREHAQSFTSMINVTPGTVKRFRSAFTSALRDLSSHATDSIDSTTAYRAVLLVEDSLGDVSLVYDALESTPEMITLSRGVNIGTSDPIELRFPILDVQGGEHHTMRLTYNEGRIGLEGEHRDDHEEYARLARTTISAIRCGWNNTMVLFSNGTARFSGVDEGAFAQDEIETYCAANRCRVLDFALTRGSCVVYMSNGVLLGKGVLGNTTLASFTIDATRTIDKTHYRVSYLRSMYDGYEVRLTHRGTGVEEWWRVRHAGVERMQKLETLLATFADNYLYATGCARDAGLVIDLTTRYLYHIGNMDHVPLLVTSSEYTRAPLFEYSFDPMLWCMSGRGALVFGTSHDEPLFGTGLAVPKVFDVASRFVTGLPSVLAEYRSIESARSGGRSTNGNMGHGLLQDQQVALKALPFATTHSFVDIRTGGAHTLGLSAEGVYAWGDNTYGQLADGLPGVHRSEPFECALVKAYCSRHHTRAWRAIGNAQSTWIRFTDGSVRCVGRNDYGTLLDGSTTHRYTLSAPSLIAAHEREHNVRLSDVYTGGFNTYVLFDNGTVFTNANNSHGQHANGESGTDLAYDRLYPLTQLNDVLSTDATLEAFYPQQNQFVARIRRESTGAIEWYGAGENHRNSLGADSAGEKRHLTRLTVLETLLVGLESDYILAEGPHRGGTLVVGTPLGDGDSRIYACGDFDDIAEIQGGETFEETILEVPPTEVRLSTFGVYLLTRSGDSTVFRSGVLPGLRVDASLDGGAQEGLVHVLATTDENLDVRRYLTTSPNRLERGSRLESGSRLERGSRRNTLSTTLEYAIDTTGSTVPIAAVNRACAVVFVTNVSNEIVAYGRSEWSVSSHDAFHIRIHDAYVERDVQQLQITASLFSREHTITSYRVSVLPETTEFQTITVPKGAAAMLRIRRSIADLSSSFVVHAAITEELFENREITPVAFVGNVEGVVTSDSLQLTLNNAAVGTTYLGIVSATPLNTGEVLRLCRLHGTTIRGSESTTIATLLDSNRNPVPVSIVSRGFAYVLSFVGTVLEAEQLRIPYDYKRLRFERSTPSLALGTIRTDSYGNVLVEGYDVYRTAYDSSVRIFAIRLADARGTDTVVHVTVRNKEFVLDGAPPLIRVGDRLRFVVNTPGHAFWIKRTQLVGTGGGVANVINNGAELGEVWWTPDSPGTYYYQCEVTPSMYGRVQVHERMSDVAVDSTIVAALVDKSSDPIVPSRVIERECRLMTTGFVVDDGTTSDIELHVGDHLVLRCDVELRVRSESYDPIEEAIYEQGVLRWTPNVSGTYHYVFAEDVRMRGELRVFARAGSMPTTVTGVLHRVDAPFVLSHAFVNSVGDRDMLRPSDMTVSTRIVVVAALVRSDNVYYVSKYANMDTVRDSLTSVNGLIQNGAIEEIVEPGFFAPIKDTVYTAASSVPIPYSYQVWIRFASEYVSDEPTRLLFANDSSACPSVFAEDNVGLVGRVRVRVPVYADVYMTATVRTGLWAHLTCTFDSEGTIARLYVDGEFVDTVDNSHSDNPYYVADLVKRDSGRDALVPQIVSRTDQLHLSAFAVWTRTLDSNEVKASYLLGRPLALEDAAHMWRFDSDLQDSMGIAHFENTTGGLIVLPEPQVVDMGQCSSRSDADTFTYDPITRILRASWSSHETASYTFANELYLVEDAVYTYYQHIHGYNSGMGVRFGKDTSMECTLRMSTYSEDPHRVRFATFAHAGTWNGKDLRTPTIGVRYENYQMNWIRMIVVTRVVDDVGSAYSGQTRKDIRYEVYASEATRRFGTSPVAWQYVSRMGGNVDDNLDLLQSATVSLTVTAYLDPSWTYQLFVRDYSRFYV